MNEDDRKWIEEPRWYYVGHGQLRYKDSTGWTDQYCDIDDPAGTSDAGSPASLDLVGKPATFSRLRSPGDRRPVSGLKRLLPGGRRRSTTGIGRETASTSSMRPLEEPHHGTSRPSPDAQRTGIPAGRRDSGAPKSPVEITQEWAAIFNKDTGKPPLSDATFTTHGTLTTAPRRGGTEDWGARTEGYDDLTAGTEVTITDASGSTLALGALDAGKYEPGESDPGAGTCVYTFTVDNTPEGEGSYSVRIGDRLGPKFTMAQMQEGPSLTIGDPHSATLEAG